MSNLAKNLIRFKNSIHKIINRTLQTYASPTINQERLWFLYRLNPRDISYNMGMAIRFDGKIDPKNIFLACDQVILRHAALRTLFTEKNQKLITIIQPLIPLKPIIIDCSNKIIDDLQLDISLRLKEQINIPYDLEQGPLIRHIVLKYSDELYVLLVSAHHIIYDGHSLFLHINEIAENYRAIIFNKSTDLPPITHQHFDFAKSQKQRLLHEKEKILTYWKNQLTGITPLELPTDKSKKLSTPVIENKIFDISLEHCKQCVNYSNKNNKSIFTILFSVFCILLYRYSGQTDFVIGVPTHGRNQKEYKNQIGFFVNILPLRVSLKHNMSFAELLEQIKENTRDALTHQEVSLADLAAQLNIKRSLNQDPLFQIMFEIDDSPLTNVQFKDIEMSLIEVDTDKAPYDIVFEVHTFSQKICLSIKYNANLYYESTIERMVNHWIKLLSTALENPDASISQLPMLTTDEYKKIVVDWNETNKVFPNKTIDLLIEEQVEKTPDNQAISYNNQSMTYRQLNEKANQLAHYLKEKNIGPDSIVAICMERSLELIVCLLGILKAGGAYLTLDPTYPQERLNYEVKETEATILITTNKNNDRFTEFKREKIIYDLQTTILNSMPISNLSKMASLDNLAYVIYTSGSTGKPKGVAIKHRGLSNLVDWYKNYFAISENDRASQFASASFDAMGCELWPYLAVGSSVHLINDVTRYDPKRLYSWIIENKITICDLPTAIAEILLKMEWPSNVNLRILKIGGEKASCFANNKYPFAIWNTYGPTESTIECIATRIDNKKDEYQIPPIGKPIQNCKAYILDSTQQPVPIGVTGELYIAGAGLAKGYLNNSLLTSERFVTNLFGNDRLYRTGDICRYLPDGNIEFIKRIDNQIKIHGFRIEPGEIESILKNNPQVKETIVLLKINAANEKQLICYWVAQDTSKIPTPNELRKYLQKYLPTYMIPSLFINLEKLPITITGKIDKQLLLSESVSISNREYIPPTTEIEYQLAKIWNEILNLKNIYLHDNFFELGGSSLTVMLLAAKINNTFNKNFTLADLFNNQTLAEQANLVNTTTEDQRIIVPINESSHQPLFCIHPVGGNVVCYYNLANVLKNKFSVYGIQYPEHHTNTYQSIAELSDLYIKEIKSIQPKGPYAFLGWSTGGLIALELAKNLLASGEKIKVLALVDTHKPSKINNLAYFNNHDFLWHFLNILLPFSKKFTWKEKSILFLLKYHLIPIKLLPNILGIKKFPYDVNSTIDLIKHDLSHLGERQFPIEDWITLVKENHILPSEYDKNKIIKLYELLRNNVYISEYYQPSFYDGDILFFTAKNSFVQRQWENLSKRLFTVKLPADHYQAIKNKQSIDVISNEIIKWGDE